MLAARKKKASGSNNWIPSWSPFPGMPILQMEELLCPPYKQKRFDIGSRRTTFRHKMKSAPLLLRRWASILVLGLTSIQKGSEPAFWHKRQFSEEFGFFVSIAKMVEDSCGCSSQDVVKMVLKLTGFKKRVGETTMMNDAVSGSPTVPINYNSTIIYFSESWQWCNWTDAACKWVYTHPLSLCTCERLFEMCTWS